MQGSIISKSIAETEAWGELLGRALLGHDALIALHGDLGAGKTCLTRGVARGWGCTAPDITSPTFSLIHEYPSETGTLYHVDLYRLETPESCLKLGLDELWSTPSIMLIEWPERLGAFLPNWAWHIHLKISSENERTISWDAIPPEIFQQITSPPCPHRQK